MLIGRHAEVAAIHETLGGVVDGRPCVVGFVGDEGSGRSSLIGVATRAARAAGALVLAARGITGDPGPAYSGLLSLLRPLESRLDTLVTPKDAAAVRTALTLRHDTTAALDVGLGVFRLISAAAEEQPVVIAIDDATSVDAATTSALTFGLARLGVDRVGAFLGLAPERSPWDGVVTSRLVLGPLGEDALAAIVRSAVECSAEAAAACSAWASGSPLLAIELARSLSDDERHGRKPLRPVPRATVRAVMRLQRQLDELPERARRALVVVAAARKPTMPAVSVALGALGEEPGGVSDAEDAGIVHVEGDELVFSHPLLRPLSYHLVAPSSRRAAHRALAAALTAPNQAAERAWHLADSCAGPDDDVASALDLVAVDARRRGALAESAAAFRRAAALSAEPKDATARRLQAAIAHLDGFDFGAALTLVGAADSDADAALLAIEAIERRDGEADALAALASAAALDASTRLAVRADLLLSAGRRSDAAATIAACSGEEREASALWECMRATLDQTMPLPVQPDGETPVGRRAYRRWLSAAAHRGVVVDDPSTPDELVATASVVGESDPATARQLVERAVAIVPAAATRMVAALERLAERFDRVAVAGTVPSIVTTILTKAERRVAEAVAAGRTNREVAEHLFVSVKTVDFHLQAIYRKLGVRSRTELAVLMATRETA
jgi:DNA-binding NarL/FixJ family response regulator